MEVDVTYNTEQDQEGKTYLLLILSNSVKTMTKNTNRNMGRHWHSKPSNKLKWEWWIIWQTTLESFKHVVYTKYLYVAAYKFLCNLFTFILFIKQHAWPVFKIHLFCWRITYFPGTKTSYLNINFTTINGHAWLLILNYTDGNSPGCIVGTDRWYTLIFAKKSTQIMYKLYQMNFLELLLLPGVFHW